MLVLVEPFINNQISDQPDLGCAMLLAALNKKGFRAKLVKTQTNYLKKLFVDESEEIWHLAKQLKPAALKKIGNGGLEEFLRNQSFKQFQRELEGLYKDAVLNRSPRKYFNALQVYKFYDLHTYFLKLYLHHINKLNNCKLNLVEGYVEEILNSRPRYIGFSLKTGFEPLSRAIRRAIKKNTHIPIIVGGSYTPFIDLNKISSIMKQECFDYLVVGEAEQALPALVDSLERRQEPRGIANVFYLKNGRVQANNLEVVKNLNSLAYPDFSQYDLNLYLTPERILPLQTSRGCSWARCSFCAHHSIYMKSFRTFSSERIIETISYLKDKYQCSHFIFNDEELPPGRARLLSQAILKSGLKGVYLSAYARMVDGYNNDNLLALMRKAGFVHLSWGMESGCQRVLDLMEKGTKVKAMSQIFKKSFQSGISNICWIMFGFPGETEMEANQTVKFLQGHHRFIDEILVSRFHLTPKSPVAMNPAKWGVIPGRHGRHSTKTGMNYKQVKSFIFRFKLLLDINNITCTSGRLKYSLPGNLIRMLFFLCSSHEIISSKKLLKLLKRRRFRDIYPVIPGEIKKEKGLTLFKLARVNEPVFINEIINKKEEEFDRIEAKIFSLSDGTLSVKEIIERLKLAFKGARTSELNGQALNFFRKQFYDHRAIGFGRRWLLERLSRKR